MAKGVASGYAAISCTVTTEEVFEQFKGEPDDREVYFRDISTFGGCTAGPAAALENLRIIEREGLLENAEKICAYLFEGLLRLQRKHPLIGEVRGKGLFLGIELVSDRETREPVAEGRGHAGCRAVHGQGPDHQPYQPLLRRLQQHPVPEPGPDHRARTDRPDPFDPRAGAGGGGGSF